MAIYLFALIQFSKVKMLMIILCSTRLQLQEILLVLHSSHQRQSNVSTITTQSSSGHQKLSTKTTFQTMTGRNPNRSFLIPTEVQPPAVTHNYPFGNGQNSNSEVSEEDTEFYELRPRGKEKTRRSSSRDRLDNIVFITKDIVEGDTLNAIALRYCCSVADIKRANSLISEQDFFALKSIKIPVKKFSFLTEAHLERDVLTSPSGPAVLFHEPEESAADFDSISPEKSAENFLEEVDRDIEQILKCTDTKREKLNQVVSALSTEQICFEPDRKGRKEDPYYGADWGMGWWTAVVIMLVVGVITPVFYLLYYEYLIEADVSHHDSPTTNKLNVDSLSEESHDVHHLKTNNDFQENSHNTLNTQTNLHRPLT